MLTQAEFRVLPEQLIELNTEKDTLMSQIEDLTASAQLYPLLKQEIETCKKEIEKLMKTEMPKKMLFRNKSMIQE